MNEYASTDEFMNDAEQGQDLLLQAHSAGIQSSSPASAPHTQNSITNNEISRNGSENQPYSDHITYGMAEAVDILTGLPLGSANFEDSQFHSAPNLSQSNKLPENAMGFQIESSSEYMNLTSHLSPEEYGNNLFKDMSTNVLENQHPSLQTENIGRQAFTSQALSISNRHQPNSAEQTMMSSENPVYDVSQFATSHTNQILDPFSDGLPPLTGIQIPSNAQTVPSQPIMATDSLSLAQQPVSISFPATTMPYTTQAHNSQIHGLHTASFENPSLHLGEQETQRAVEQFDSLFPSLHYNQYPLASNNPRIHNNSSEMSTLQVSPDSSNTEPSSSLALSHFGTSFFNTAPIAPPPLSEADKEQWDSDILLYRLVNGPKTPGEAKMLGNKDGVTGLSFQDILNKFPQFDPATIKNDWERVRSRRSGDFAFRAAICKAFLDKQGQEVQEETKRTRSKRWTAHDDATLIRYGSIMRDWGYISTKIPGRTAIACRDRYRNLKRDDYRQFQIWSSFDDEMLQQFYDKHNGNFSNIAKEWKWRTAEQCENRWLYLQEKMKKTWTLEDDLLLSNLAQMHGDNFKVIASHMPDREMDECRDRWNKTKFQKGSLRMRPRNWTADEDKILFEVADKCAKDFHMIAKMMPHRSANSLRARWSYLTKYRKESISVYYSWTKDEELLLQQLVNQHGKKWVLISSHFFNRTPNACKRRWFILTNTDRLQN